MFIYDAIICVTNHFIYRKYSCSSFERIIYIAPPVAALITFFQLLSPNTMLSGTATALTLFIYFINFQQQKNNTDHLTGLINREGFYETITNYTKRKTPFRMIIVCLHGFKSINSHFGQKTADLFLKAVGRYIVSIRRDALVCRLSGVEFAIILTETDEKEYDNYVLKLTKRFDFPWVIEDLKCELHAYFTDISFENHTPDHEELVSFLEFSSHLSNQHNFGHMVHFNENVKELYSHRNHLVELLDYAYKYNLFSLNFQPVFNCNTNNFSGAEALLRLKDGDGSFIPPSEFIPIAEETGLIIDISWMVLEKVCYFLSTHKDLPIDSISINFSIQQFQDENMVNIFLSIIKKYNVPPQKIKIEITERIVAENIAQVFNLMETLCNNGIDFYLDDFGIGYSNLARISNLPFECVKIDRSLVDNLDNENTIQIFKAIIYAIKLSGKKALIEGIETRQQHNNIDKLDLDMIQGYFYSRPLSEQDYINFINNHQ